MEGKDFKVLMGTNPIEVEEWRQQRRKKFPTLANISQKKKEKREYLQAGGIINEKIKNEMKKENIKRSREREREEEENVDLKRQKSSISVEELIPRDEKKGNEEEEEEGTDRMKKGKVYPCRNFRMGKCRRGEQCKYSHILSHGTEENDTINSNSKVCSYFLKEKCRRGSRCHLSHSTPSGVEEKVENKVATSITPKSQSLYLKLVESEVHNEENILLQCIRFLVNENFLTS